MTATTNGASLEDCLTNIFSLIDLNGIRWKRFKQKEQQHHHQGNNYLYTPIDTHPILTTYAKCIEENHIAVWRLEPPKKHSASTGANSHGGGGGNTSSTGHSNFPTPTRTSNNNTPTGGVPASLTNNNSNQNNNSQNNYELWIFGYGHQLKVDNVIGDDLVEIEDDTWESKGLSYECRTLLFKALHNLIERCLITKGFTKIGRWFVQPLAEDPLNHQQSLNSSHYGCPLLQKPFKQTKVEPSSITRQTNSSLSSTISSNLDRIIGIRAQNFESRQCLDKSDGLRHISIRSSSTYFTTSLDGSKLSLSFAFSFFVHGDSTICATVDVRQHPLIHPLTRQDLNTFQEGGIVRVALAPFGLNGILNGVSYKDCDDGAATTTFIQQWSKFYPLPKTLSRLSTCSKSSSNSAMSNFNQKGPTNTNQYNQTSDVQANNSSRSYLSNLTNMLLPPTQRPTISFNYEPNEVPPIVEVIVAGCRMRYPSECVFTTAKVVDPYKSLSMNSGQRLSNLSTHRKPNKNNHSKPNKLSLLSGKTNEEKLDPLVKVKEEPEQTKTQTNFNSPFRLSSSEGKNNTTTQKSDGATNMNSKQTSSFDSLRDKAPNGNFESSDTGNNLFNSTSNQTTISRYNSSKVGFSSSNAPLGPTDLVKLFPTPPSLEQIVLSPSGIAEESTIKEATVLSPANLTFNNSHCFKDNGIDVYKPVECAIMPPPPKWAALTNIVISSSKSLPPECIYKGSSQNNTSKNATKSSDFTKGTSIKNYCNTKQLHSTLTKTNSSQSISSPLTDQTNKNGFHNSNLNTPPAKTSTSSSLLTGPNQSTNSINQTNGSVCPSSTFTLFTLPHQKLFNNLNEVNSIQLNLMLSDSALGMFKDHNFESCTLCVCNMSVKGTQTDIIPQRAESNNLWRHTSGYDNIINSSTPTNEFTNECTCGFSAINNRHCSHLSGLFLEDELELTNVLYDPTEMIDQNKLFRKVRLSNYSEAACNDEQKLITKLTSDLASKTSTKSSDEDSKSNLKQDKVSKEDKSSQSNRNAFEEAKIFVIDQLKQQCTTMIHSNSSLSKVLLIESFRNNRHLTGCSNYYAQTSSKVGSNGPFFRFMDDSNKYTTVKMMNRNPTSLKFSDFCELTKSIITKLGNQNQMNSRLANSLVKPPGSTSSGLSAIFSRMFGSNRTSLIAKSSDASSRNNIFIQGLQALVVPTLSIDAKGALQMLEHLVKEESKEALATLNKAILIFSSPMHDWQFLTAPVPENNFDVANLLKIIQPSLEESIGSHNKLYKDFVHQQQQHLFSARDSPTGGAPTLPTPPCQGPLTWRLFHQAAGRGTEDQCEPQPIPSLLVGHNVEKNHLAVSPFALKFWDKLLLEPYAPSHNIFYLVIAPDNQNILGHINPFFKELSNTYELLKLGRHVPIGNGLIVATNPEGGSEEEDWFSKLDLERELSGNIISRLEAYASKLNSGLAKTIIDFIEERQPPYDPHADRFTSSPTPQNAANLPQTNRLSQYPANRTSKQLLSGFNSTSGASQDPQIYTSENPMSSDLVNQLKSQALIGSSTHGGTEDNVSSEDEINKQSGIVIYMIDPFSSPSITQNLRTLSTIGLFKCYSLLLEKLPESVRRITQLQLVSLDSILSHSRPILNISRVDQLKSLSMNVYSRCRKIVTNQATAKSLTGFGPSAALENFFKTKSNDLSITRMFTPPFILAPMKDKQTELVEIRQRLEISSVLFCSYCITEDQRWLLASLTNDKGEMSETTVININIIDRMKKPKTSVRRIALRKLMDFIVSTMSDWMNPWRLIIGKLGRVGHGELKEWASIMSKRSLLNYSRHLSDRCRQCSILPSTETVSILSACLVSLEPDSKLRIMPDQFTSDDRQASFNKCPLNTPEDASATHILVFPTSASIQSAHGNVEDPLAGSGLDDDLLNQFPLEDGIEDLGVEENMDDLFAGAWDDNPPNISDHISSHHDTMLSSSNLPLGSGSVGDNANNQDENLQLLQQPLALGYYISTAKIGQMPNWFWSTSPHLRNSCPVYLKSALHIHMPCVQLSDDLLHSGVGQQNRHQLDSNLTTDVLRYVLEGYNSLSWLALNPKTYDRQSCLPVHMQNLLQLYHLMESFS